MLKINKLPIVLFFVLFCNFANCQLIVNLGEDKKVCSGDTITLDAGVEAAYYLWSTGDSTKTIDVTTSGIYSVSVSYEITEVVDEIEITFEPTAKSFLIPNIFTPNGDAVNDVFYAKTENKFVSEYELSIFNRLGQKLFFAESPYIGWDGRTSTGEKVSSGTYFYVITYSPVCDEGSIKGSITLK